jgi:hypothetical protein
MAESIVALIDGQTVKLKLNSKQTLILIKYLGSGPYFSDFLDDKGQIVRLPYLIHQKDMPEKKFRELKIRNTSDYNYLTSSDMRSLAVAQSSSEQLNQIYSALEQLEGSNKNPMLKYLSFSAPHVPHWAIIEEVKKEINLESLSEKELRNNPKLIELAKNLAPLEIIAGLKPDTLVMTKAQDALVMARPNGVILVAAADSTATVFDDWVKRDSKYKFLQEVVLEERRTNPHIKTLLDKIGLEKKLMAQTFTKMTELLENPKNVDKVAQLMKELERHYSHSGYLIAKLDTSSFWKKYLTALETKDPAFAYQALEYHLRSSLMYADFIDPFSQALEGKSSGHWQEVLSYALAPDKSSLEQENALRFLNEDLIEKPQAMTEKMNKLDRNTNGYERIMQRINYLRASSNARGVERLALLLSSDFPRAIDHYPHDWVAPLDACGEVFNNPMRQKYFKKK